MVCGAGVIFSQQRVRYETSETSGTMSDLEFMMTSGACNFVEVAGGLQRAAKAAAEEFDLCVNAVGELVAKEYEAKEYAVENELVHFIHLILSGASMIDFKYSPDKAWSFWCDRACRCRLFSLLFLGTYEWSVDALGKVSFVSEVTLAGCEAEMEVCLSWIQSPGKFIVQYNVKE